MDTFLDGAILDEAFEDILQSILGYEMADFSFRLFFCAELVLLAFKLGRSNFLSLAATSRSMIRERLFLPLASGACLGDILFRRGRTYTHRRRLKTKRFAWLVLILRKGRLVPESVQMYRHFQDVR
jgi:hypothetical protein